MRNVHRSRAKSGFTLVEIMVAAAVTVILVGILLQITTLAGTTVTLSTQKLSAFASARTAFDVLTRNLSQATLNTYLDYYGTTTGGGRTLVRRTDANSDINNSSTASNGQTTTTATFLPVTFGRASDLQFLIQANQQNPNYGQEVYFQAPRSYSTDPSIQSVSSLLNACGYYVQFGNSDLFEPGAVYTKEQAGKIPAKYRYRLMQGFEPTESLQVFAAVDSALAGSGTTTDSSATWLTNIKNGSGKGSVDVTPLADNVIALVVWPRLSVNDDPTGELLLPASHAYSYDSQANVAPTANISGTGAAYTQVLAADQLPPDVQVTMVVLDEASALRMQGASTTAPTTIETALSGKFSNADNYSADLSNLANALSAAHLNFQIFNTTVALRESKWSINQK
jgi:uncharacterized protein (TIGR02599 family)